MQTAYIFVLHQRNILIASLILLVHEAGNGGRDRGGRNLWTLFADGWVKSSAGGRRPNEQRKCPVTARGRYERSRQVLN